MDNIKKKIKMKQNETKWKEKKFSKIIEKK